MPGNRVGREHFNFKRVDYEAIVIFTTLQRVFFSLVN